MHGTGLSPLGGVPAARVKFAEAARLWDMPTTVVPRQYWARSAAAPRRGPERVELAGWGGSVQEGLWSGE